MNEDEKLMLAKKEIDRLDILTFLASVVNDRGGYSEMHN